MTEERAHSIFAPSSARRWINCPQSIRVSRHFKDSTNEAAMEGTAAHFLFEYCITHNQNAGDHKGIMLKVTEGEIEKRFPVDDEMIGNVQLALDFARGVMASEPGKTSVEETVSLEHIEPGFYGHSDFIHDASSYNGILTVIDYKNGYIDVDVSGNEQAFCYTVGALNTLKVCAEPHKVRFVRIVIIQPRSFAPGGPIKQVVVPIEEVRQFERDLKFAVERTKDVHAPLNVGDWCKYCPALGICPATADRLSVIGHMMNVDIERATNEQISMIFNTKSLIEQMLKKVEAEATKRLMMRKNLPDMKLVTATTYRKWVDEEAVKKQLFEKYGLDAMVPLSPAKAEKLGATGKAVAQSLAKAPTGAPVAANQSDKRKPYVVRSVSEIFG